MLPPDVSEEGNLISLGSASVSIKRETVAENTLANLVGAKRGSNSDLEDEATNLGKEVESMIEAAKQMCYDYEPARSEVDLRITVDLQADDILYVFIDMRINSI